MLAKAEESLGGKTQTEQDSQRAEVSATREALRQAELRLANTEVRAPFTGRIGEVFVSSGEFVTAGQTAVRFISDGGFDMSVAVTEIEVRHITLGQEMRARLETTNEEVSVRVRAINATETLIGGSACLYSCTGCWRNNHSTPRPGLTADVFNPPFGKKEQLLAIPAKAISKKDTGEMVVIVEKEGMQTEIVVQVIGSAGNGLTTIEGAISEGDMVIIPSN